MAIGGVVVSEFHTGFFQVLKARGLYTKKAKGNIIFFTLVQPLPLLEPRHLECLSNLSLAEFSLREGKLTCLARLIPYGWSWHFDLWIL